jgi:hypothetical protein
MNSKNPAPEHDRVDPAETLVDEKKRRLLTQLRKSSYLAPMALAVMTMKANACSVTC